MLLRSANLFHKSLQSDCAWCPRSKTVFLAYMCVDKVPCSCCIRKLIVTQQLLSSDNANAPAVHLPCTTRQA